jgi:hypothetical protein
MSTTGRWFDDTSHVTSVITLGGHHTLVLWLSASGFAILAVMALWSGGFAEVTNVQAVLLALAGVVSVLALAGVISVFALVVGTAFLIALLGRALLR